MTSPMSDDLPEHLLIPVDADGRGPVMAALADRWACWCGVRACTGPRPQ